MIRILIFILLSSIASSAQTFNSDLIKYTNTVFKQAATGEIPIFDSLLRKLSADSLYTKYISAKPGMADNLSNNFYTRNTFQQAAFINNFHFGLFEGLMGLPDLPAFLFDTLTYKPNDNYIVFRLYRYNDDGSPKDRKKLFIVSRRATEIDKKLILNKVIRQAKDSVNRLWVKQLITTGNESWHIEEVIINNKKAIVDICQSRYRLALCADMHFQQYYTDTSDYTINRKAGIGPGIERGFYYPNGIQHTQCYLENEQGMWVYNKGKLVLMTTTGIVLGNYKLSLKNKDHIEIQTKNFRIKLKKS